MNRLLLNKVVVLFLLTSCSGNDDPVIPNVPGPVGNQTCLLKSLTSTPLSYQIIRNEAGLPVTIRYENVQGKSVSRASILEYDLINRVIKLGNDDVFFTYEYDEEHRVVMEKFDGQPNSPIPIFRYDTQRTFTYNDEGYLDSAYYSQEVYERYIYDGQGNIIQKFSKYHGEPEFLSKENLLFDDKENPFLEFSFTHQIILSLSGIDAIVTSFNPERNKNNVLKAKSYSFDGKETSHIATPSYDDSGYIIAIPGDVSVYYTYQCE